MPKVSVIIPTYNRASLLPRAINSVLQQTYSDFELIIVDDASSDDTQSVIRSFADPRIRSTRHRLNKDLAASRNTGIACARGEYIAFLDDDDEWRPDYLAGQVATLDSASSDVGMVYAFVDEVSGLSGKVTPRFRPRVCGDVFEAMVSGVFLAPMIASLIRAEVIARVGGFDERMLRIEDRDLVFRIARHYEVAVRPEVGALFHVEHVRPRTQHRWPGSTGYRLFVEKHARFLKQPGSIYALWLRRMAISEFREGSRYKALALAAEALWRDPIGVMRAILRNARFTIRLLRLFTR